MAEDSNPTDKPVSVKRRLRSESETVRQRAEKLQHKRVIRDSSDAKPGSAFVRGFTAPLRALGRFKVFQVIGKVLYPPFLRRSVAELRLVSWPSRGQSWRLTYAVIIFSLIFGALVAVIDFGLDKLFKELILK